MRRNVAPHTVKSHTAAPAGSSRTHGRARLGTAAALALSAFLLFGQGALAAPGREYYRNNHTITLSGDLEYRDNISTATAPLEPYGNQGGAISVNATLTINGKGNLTFINNHLEKWPRPFGGAIRTQGQLIIDIDGDLTAVGNRSLHGGTATSNTGNIGCGGAFHGETGISLKANNILFEDNHAGLAGGALHTSRSPITVVAADNITFRSNQAGLSADISSSYTAGGQGGVLQTTGHVILEAGDTILLENNASIGLGGAIEAGLKDTGNGLTMKASHIRVLGNKSTERGGGAIGIGDGLSIISENEILFEDNIAGNGSGGVVNQIAGALSLVGKTIIFRSNKAPKGSGGALYITKGAAISSHILSADTIEFLNNQAQYGNSIATNTEGTFTIHAKELNIRDNYSLRQTNPGTSTGAVYFATNAGSFDVKADHIQFVKNSSTGNMKAMAGGLRYSGAQTATLTAPQHFYEENTAHATGEGGEARGGFAYALRPLFINATEGALFKNNTATAPQGTALGGAIWASSDVTITMGDDNTIGDLVFNGNSATGADGMGLGGAIYSENGDITLRRASDLGAVFDFATATDDVFARSGNIFIEGMLIAKPGTSFAAGNGVIFGEGSTLTVQGFVSKDDVNMSDMALFGGHELSFNRAKLTLTDYDKLVPVPDPDNPQSSRHYKIDVVSVLVNENFAQHVLGGAASADITDEDWALDIKNYRRGKLWLDTAVVPDADSQRLSAELGLTQNAKLVLEFDRHSLIWNGQPGDVWQAANDSKQVWLMAKEDNIFEPELDENGSPIPDSFWRGDIVVFDGRDSEPNVKIAGSDTGDALHPDHPETPNISAAQVWVVGGQYTFSPVDAHPNAHLRTDLLVVSNDGTTADFRLPVRVFESVDIGEGAQALFTNLVTLVDTPVNVAGNATVHRPVEGAYTVTGTGVLTLEEGSGIMHSLNLENGSTFKVNALSSYGVIDSFTAKTGSRTVVTVGSTWAPDTRDFILTGEGEAKATVESGARLTISGIEKGATGTWKLLHDFDTIDGKGWNKIKTTTLSVVGYDGLIDKEDDPGTGKQYLAEVKLSDDGKDYELIITQTPENPSPEPQEERPQPAPKPQTPQQPVTPAVHRLAGNVQRSVAIAAAAHEPAPDKQFWIHGWRDMGRLYDTGGALEMKTDAWGVVVGRDLSRNEKKTLGLAAHIGKASHSGKGTRDGETGDSDFWGVLLYGRRETDKWLLTGDAGFTWYRTDHNRASGATADKAKSSMFSAGGRAYYKLIDTHEPGKLNVRPFVGLRWNYFRQNEFSFTNGLVSDKLSVGQLHVPMGVRFEWNESKSKNGWHTRPIVEAGYIRTVGSRRAKAAVRAPEDRARVFTPLGDADTFVGQARFEARRKNFTWSLNAGFRRSSSEKDLNLGTTLRWEL